VQDERDADHQHRPDQLAPDVARGHAQDVAEEQGGDVGGERRRARHDHDAEGQHPDEEQADADVLAHLRAPAHHGDGAAHEQGRHQGADGGAGAPQHGEGQARDDAVGQGVAEEGQAPQHDPGADDGGGDAGHEPRQEGPLHELRLEGGGEPLDRRHARASTIRSALVRTIST
jgi:hypothetical protein